MLHRKSIHRQTHLNVSIKNRQLLRFKSRINALKSHHIACYHLRQCFQLAVNHRSEELVVFARSQYVQELRNHLASRERVVGRIGGAQCSWWRGQRWRQVCCKNRMNRSVHIRYLQEASATAPKNEDYRCLSDALISHSF